MNDPSESVVSVRRTSLVFSFRTWTLAPATAAPLLSWTVPLIAPVAHIFLLFQTLLMIAGGCWTKPRSEVKLDARAAHPTPGAARA